MAFAAFLSPPAGAQDPFPDPWFCDTAPPAASVPGLAVSPWAASPSGSPDRNIPFVLADFSDLPGTVPPEEVGRILFGKNPDGNLSEYFHWVSYGRARVTGEVVADGDGWFTVGSLVDLGDSRQVFAREAVKKADPSVDFRRFLSPGEENLDVVAVVHSGCGSAGGGRIFRAGYFFIGLRTDDGVLIENAVLVPEYWEHEFNSGDCNIPVPMSITCHEILHSYGLPDLKIGRRCGEPSGSSTMLGRWDLMDAGAWGAGNTVGSDPGFYDTAHPSNINPWFKARLGWLDPEVVAESGFYPLEPYEDRPQAALVWLRRPTSEDEGEFFLLANWAATGFQRTLPGKGLMIWHVEPGRQAGPPWPYALEQADGACRLELPPNGRFSGDGGDPWPGSEGRFAMGPSHRFPDEPPWTDFNGACDAYATPCANPGRSSGWTLEAATAERESGLEVTGATITFLDDQSPQVQPPAIRFPRDGSITTRNPVEFMITDSPRTSESLPYFYDFALADDPAFPPSSILAGYRVPEGGSAGGTTGWTLPFTLPPGVYFWRVAARVDVERSPWVAASFRIPDVKQHILTGEDGERAGEALAIGDFDGDGANDILLSRSGGHGAGPDLLLVFGADRDRILEADRLTDLPHAAVGARSPSMDFTTAHLSVGDLNGDGYADVAVGVPAFRSYEGTQAGAAYVVAGRPRDSQWPALIESADLTLTHDAPEHELGSAVLIANLDADPFDDLLVGRTCAILSRCDDLTQVFVVKGARSFFEARSLDVDASGRIDVVFRSSAARLGARLAAGHFRRDGDPYPDLAFAGAENAVRILFGDGRRGTVDMDGAPGFRVRGRTGSLIMDQLLFTDLDGDGDEDLFFAQWQGHRIFGILGGSENPGPADGSPLVFPDAADVEITAIPPGSYGAAALAAGRMSDDAADDLILGVELAEPDGFAYQGAVQAYFGRDSIPARVDLSGALTADGSFTQGGSAEYAFFGHAVGAGDVDGDGAEDLVAAAPGGSGTAGGIHIFFGPLGPAQTRSAPAPTKPRLDAAPNPFLGAAAIRFVTEEDGWTTLEVYDVRGRRIRRLASEEMREGSHRIAWDGADEEGRTARPGIYFAKLTEPAGVRSCKLIRLGR